MSSSGAGASGLVHSMDLDSEYYEMLLAEQYQGLNSKPSETTCCKWLIVRNETNQNNMRPVCDEEGKRLSGNWMIFKSVEVLDKAWDAVKLATKFGQLGYMSMVRTIRHREGLEPNFEKKVICVSTYDARDEEDVWRVREALRQLGFTAETQEEKLKYKTHEATDQFIYYDKNQEEYVSLYQD